jgi:Type II secretion system (T2SS), protein N
MPASTSPRRGVEGVRPPARRWPWVLAGVIVLIPAGVALLPASMIGRFLPAQVRAEDFSGSFLHGAAGKIMVNARDAGAIEWQIHPLSLLRLAAVADIRWVKVGFVIDGTVELTRQGASAHDIRGGGPIDSLRDLGLAAGWRGNAVLSFADLKTDFTTLQSIQGRIEANDLSSDRIAEGGDLGSYVLQLGEAAISPDGNLTGTLSDAGGPLEVQAQIRFSPGTRTGLFSGTLKERPEASPALRNQLNSLAQLRARDAAGRFPVELEFSF